VEAKCHTRPRDKDKERHTQVCGSLKGEIWEQITLNVLKICMTGHKSREARAANICPSPLA
jgi:hypothetical protein